MPIDPVTLGLRLRELRRRAGLNQAQAVAALDVEIQCSQLSKIERGRSLPSLNVLCSLADLYGVSLDTLRWGDEQSDEEALLAIFRAATPRQRRALLAVGVAFGKGDHSATS